MCSIGETFPVFLNLNYAIVEQGIYETKVAQEFNAVLQIGCVCKADKTAKKRNVQTLWNLNELQMKTTTECQYLELPLSFFYLYHR